MFQYQERGAAESVALLRSDFLLLTRWAGLINRAGITSVVSQYETVLPTIFQHECDHNTTDVVLTPTVVLVHLEDDVPLLQHFSNQLRGVGVRYQRRARLGELRLLAVFVRSFVRMAKLELGPARVIVRAQPYFPTAKMRAVT